MEAFHAALQSLREASGASSARAFYLRHGGPRFFGCTYKQYRNAEAGRTIPSPRLAERIAEALRLEASPTAARRFMESYLRLLLGSERLANMAFGAGTRATASPLEAAMSRSFEKPKHISYAATEYLYASPENYWAFMILTNDSGSWSPEDISRLALLPVPRIKKALEGLRKHKIAVKGRDGRWRSPLFEFPLSTAAAAERRIGYHDTLERYLGMDSGRGKTVARRLLLVRASAADMAHYQPMLVKSLISAGAFATTDAGPDTGLYVIHGRVRRVATF